MSPPASISVAFYRSFRRWTTLELRPLTLLYGPNNVGKSALLRLLPLLHDSIEPGATVPFVLSGPAGRGAVFRDVLWSGERESDELAVLGLRLDWRAPSGTRGLDLEIEELNPVTPIVRSFRVFTNGDGPLWTARRVPKDGEDPAGELTFEIRGLESKAKKVKFRFGGLLPEQQKSGRRLPELLEIAEALSDFQRAGTQWLTAPRNFDGRLVPRPVGKSQKTLPAKGGEGVLQALYLDEDLTRRVSDWYRSGGGNAATQGAARELRFEPVSPSHVRAWMTPPGKAGPRVDVADAGAGWVQLLPVLTALAQIEKSRTSCILAIEEPEANLHPSAQRAVAEAVVDVIRAVPDARIVLETHSYPLLQYIQLEILRKRLATSDVCAYWVYQTPNGESRLTKGTFDEDGRLDGGWPTSAFDESLQLAREIADARRKKGSNR